MGSKSSSNTQKSEFITTTNENISDVDGVVASDGAVINQLDGGAINRSFDLGQDSLDFGVDALEHGSDALTDALDFGSFGLDRVLDFGSELAADSADQLTNTLASINAANATGATLTSANQQETIRTVVKFVTVSAVIGGVLFGSVWLFKRARA